MLVSINAKICLTPQRETCAFPPTQTRNANQWNVGCVGSPTQNLGVGHVHLIFVYVYFIRVGSRFSVEYGLNVEGCGTAVAGASFSTNPYT